MADVDTIVILDGLQNAKDSADKIYTMDGDGQNYEAVKTYVVELPPDASGARVIFNGKYANDMEHHVRVLYTAITATTPTKTENTIALDWTLIDTNSATGTTNTKETGAINVSGHLGGTLHISVAVSEAGATSGLEVIVQVRGYTGLDVWTDLTRFVGPVGTAVEVAMPGDEAAAQTVLSVTNPTAGHLNHTGKFIFIEDVNTPVDSEICFLIECGADA